MEAAAPAAGQLQVALRFFGSERSRKRHGARESAPRAGSRRPTVTPKPAPKGDVMENRKLGFEIHKTARLTKRYMDSDALKSYVDKITGTHGWAIGYLYHNRDKDIFQKDFEQKFNIRRSTASSILSLMEKNGLIFRESVTYDARLKKITLTQKAVEIQTTVDAAFDRFENMIKQDISNEELEVFFKVLDKINQNIEGSDAG